MASEVEREKMAALKTAYADIMFNTAKESAARILASEKKALMYQKALFDAKEEALAVLMRAKSVMDAKINEAELKSLNQDRKIMELELQLNEAENIIMDLREKLERAENESKQTYGYLIESTTEKKKEDHATSNNAKCQENQLSPDSIGTPLVKSETAPLKNISVSSSAFSSKDSNPDLASIILGSKEPELFRNGCTQRIHAIEHSTQSLEPETAHTSNGYKNGYGYDSSFRKPRTKCVQLNKRDNTNSALSTIDSATQERPLKLAKSISASFSSAKFNDLDDKRSDLNSGIGLVQCINKIVTGQAVVKPNDENHIQVDELKMTEANQDIEEKINCLEMKVDAPMVHSNTEDETKGNDKLYKYTFQRKRRRASLCAKAISPEKSMVPSLGTHHDDRRIVQVAHQLISLSEKKW